MESPVTGWRRFASMNPLAFALMLSYSLSDTVMTDWLIYQTCRTATNLTKSECDILHQNSSSKEAMRIEKLVQPHTGVIIVLGSCIQTIFPTLLALFLGPWSDKYGRKPLLVFPFTGYVLYYFLSAFLSTLNVNPYWFLLPTIFASLFGGFPPILMTLFCYITDITDQQNRAWHLACLHTSIYTGILVGLFFGPNIFKGYGYVTVFSISAVANLLAVLYTIFFIVETVQNDNKRTFRSIFDSKLVKELFCAVTEKRDGFDRCLVWTCIATIVLHVIVLQGNGAISYLFTSAKLGWNISEFSIFSAVQISIGIAGMLFLIRVAGSVLNLPDVAIIILSFISLSMSALGKAFVQRPWQMYLAAGMGVFSSASVPVIRSIISNSVPQKDLGKVYSLTTIMELIVPFATTPLYIFIYTHTLNIYPSVVWFLSAVFPVFMIIFSIIIERRWRHFKNMQYTPFAEVIN